MGGCTGANTGDTGDTCSVSADCKVAILSAGTTRDCVPPYRPDGGSSGWPGGYCSNIGCTSYLQCPGTNASCGDDDACYVTCLIAGGQSNCRPGYICSYQLVRDGGTFPLCQPDCRNAGSTYCGAFGTCSPTSGECR
jgi:hypothetical protein